MSLTGIVFDKDGTLYDFDATWGAWTMRMLESEAAGDAVLIEALAEMLGFDTATRRFRPDSVVIAHTTPEVVDVMLPLLPGRRRSELISRMDDLAADAPQVEATELRELFENLRGQGIAVGVVTNDSEAPARAHLAASGVLERIDFLAGADSGYGAKPAPGQLEAFCATTGRAPGNCLMVGDSLHDLMAGRAAGLRTLGVLTGPASREELAPMAEAVLPSIAELPRWLEAAGK